MRRNRSVVAACRHRTGSASALAGLFCDELPRWITSGFLRVTAGLLRAPDHLAHAGTFAAALAAGCLAHLRWRLRRHGVAGYFTATSAIEVAPRRRPVIVPIVVARPGVRLRRAGYGRPRLRVTVVGLVVIRIPPVVRVVIGRTVIVVVPIPLAVRVIAVAVGVVAPAGITVGVVAVFDARLAGVIAIAVAVAGDTATEQAHEQCRKQTCAAHGGTPRGVYASFVLMLRTRA